jgi:hypothetical protein
MPRMHAPNLSGVFITASSRHAVGRRLRRRLGQAVGAFRPRCRTGPSRTRLASELRDSSHFHSGIWVYPNITHVTDPYRNTTGA